MSPDFFSDAGRAALQERLAGLHESLSGARDRLKAQDQALEVLRRELSEVRRLRERERSIAAPAMSPPPAIIARSAWRSAAAYAAVAVAVLALSVAAPWRRASARPSFKALRPPEAQTPLLDPQSLAEQGANDDALSLVYSFIPPGARRSVQEMLGPEAQSKAGGSPWVFINIDSRTTLASFTPYGEEADAAYEFVVDRLERTVSAGPDTLLNLRTLAELGSR